MTILDYILIGSYCLLGLLGLTKGLSGQLGIAAGVVVGFLAAPWVRAFTAAKLAEQPAWIIHIATLVTLLIIFWLVRKVVAKFLHFTIGGVIDHLLGLCLAAVQIILLTLVLLGVGLVNPGDYSQTFLVPYSAILTHTANFADAHAAWLQP